MPLSNQYPSRFYLDSKTPRDQNAYSLPTLTKSELAGAPPLVVAVISLAQMAVDALVADASVIGIWRYSGLQVFVSHFDRHFDKVQRAVVPAALRGKYFSSDCRDRCNKFESSVSNFTLQMETNQNLGICPLFH